jgi:hypothetical protein
VTTCRSVNYYPHSTGAAPPPGGSMEQQFERFGDM